ncbi:MAG: hypothetical protein OHK0036_00070 [Bacteroidia bacterium]
MKNSFLSFFIFGIILTSFSQPQFTSNHCFQLNDTSRLGFAVVTNQDFDALKSLTGSNYTWDFSSGQIPGPWTSWTSPTVEYKFQPSSQSIHSLFHNTQINEYANTPFARDVFYSYSNNNDTLYYEGVYTTNNYPAKPRFAYLTFPLNFNDSTGIWVQQFANPNQPTYATGSVTRSWKYDGFGTVVFPYGTATNVYRIKTLQVDSSYLSNQAITYEEFIWFRQSDGIPVLRFLKNGTLISAYYASSFGANGLNENFNKMYISVHPNPFNENIIISNHTNKNIEIINLYDYTGNLILSKKYTTNIINSTSLSNGLYIIEVVFLDKTKIQKKIIKDNSIH